MIRLFVFVLTTMLAVAAARADDVVAFGEYLAGECVSCHQLSGINNGIPSITGWDKEVFVRTLKAYKQKERIHPVMEMVTAPLTDEEMEALATYFATLKKNDEKGEQFLGQ